MKSNRQLCVSINSHQSAFNATLLLSSLYLANLQKSRKKIQIIETLNFIFHFVIGKIIGTNEKLVWL